MKTLKKLSFIWLLITLSCGSVFAGNWVPTAGGTYTLTSVGTNQFKVNGEATVYDAIGAFTLYSPASALIIEFNTSQVVYVAGEMIVRGADFTLILGDGYTSDVTLKRADGYKGFLITNVDRNGVYPNFSISGTASKYFTIDGNAVCNVTGSNETGYSLTLIGGEVATGPLISASGVSLFLNHVKLRNNYSSVSNGAMRLRLEGASEIRNTIIENCAADEYGGCMTISENRSNIDPEMLMENTTIRNCFCTGDNTTSGSGIIRTYGGSRCSLELKNCTLTGNKVYEGAVFSWQSGYSSLKLDNCTISDNFSDYTIASIASLFTVKNCRFLRNYAKGNGGAITINMVANVDADYSTIPNLTVDIDASTVFEDNYSEKSGGAIFLYVYPFVGRINQDDSNPYTFFQNGDGEQFEMSLKIDGATFRNNHANDWGGAIYMLRTTRIYKSDVQINSGTFENNSAGWGGAVFVESHNNATYYGTCPFPLTDLNVSIGTEGGNASALSVIGNTASTHGGFGYITGEYLKVKQLSGTIGTQAKPNKAGINGGALYVDGGDVTISGGTMQYNEVTDGNGGGIYVTGGNVTMSGGTVQYNQCKDGYGGGIFVNGGKFTTTGGNVQYNQAKNGGGVYVASGNCNIGNSAIKGNRATQCGGGIYAMGNFSMNGGSLSSNRAEPASGGNSLLCKGGGVFVNGGDAVFYYTIVNSNSSANIGGGFCCENGSVQIIGSDVLKNNAENDGGGGYMNGGEGYFLEGRVTDNTAKNGGGLFINDGKFILYSGSIGGGSIGGGYSGNTATQCGGGVYVQGGEIDFLDYFSLYAPVEMSNNTASYGGGLYIKGTDASHKALAKLNNGFIERNIAQNDGGGFYIGSNARLELSGLIGITSNRCTSGNGGGGIIDGGTVTIDGASSSSSFNVINNTAGGKKDNLYLKGENDYVTVLGTGEMLGLCQVGISISDDHLPKKVIHADDRDLMQDLYAKLKDHTSRIFDDKEIYEVVYSNTEPYSNDYIYFIRTWKTYVADDDWIGYDFYNIHEISNPIQLSQFMMLVNGIAKFPADIDMNRVNYDGIITADIDMGESLWIPIGEYHVENYPSSVPPFKGTLDGGGHVIRNLRCEGLTSYEYYGLVGKSQGATVKNIVMSDCHLVSGEAKRMGAIIADMEGGVMDNCVASGTIDMSGSETMAPDSYEYCAMGGLVGEARGNAKLYNCMAGINLIALPKLDVTTYKDGQKFTVGGLAGIVRSGSEIKNGYANVTIRHGGDNRGSADNTVLPRPVGGLAGSNAGTIANCYVRLDRPETKLDQIVADGAIVTATQETASLFGMFAGNNTGSITNCYAPDGSLFVLNRKYVQAGNAPAIYGDYAPAITPYYYNHDDNKVTMKNGTVDGANLLAKLNTWVSDNNPSSGSKADEYTPTYSTWMRTSASPINADYPLLTFDDLDEEHQYTTVGSHDGVDIEYSKSLQNIINSFNGTANTGSGCLYVYKTPGDNTSEGFMAEQISVANNANVALYIQEKVALRNAVALPNTYTGITLDNSAGANGANPYAGGTDAIDWHMFATPLEGAPLGIDYADEVSHPFTWDAQANPLCCFYDEATEDGYFPSKTFGTTNPETGSYYHDWDFYTYDEPSYHWINFKRNKQSHWHEDVGYGVDPSIPENHEHINYTGTEYESGLQRGKGYLLAVKNNTFLQSHGRLRPNGVDCTLTASASEETGCKGYNLIGNPYQSYLDFDEFASTNNDGIEKEDKITSYIILDEDAKGYVSYAVGGSVNYYPSAEGDGPAEGYKAPTNLINMHQGFFVVTNSDKTVQFKHSMRRFTADENTHFRGSDRLAYPLVNLVVTEENGNRDYLTVELDRPDTGGAVKMKGIRMGTSQIYTHCDDKDYSIAFMPCGTTSVPVRFETTEAGTFSLSWNTCNGTFSYLHLIDNMTGVDIDCLASDEYRFTASPTDYASRFRLVFSYTGVEENEAASASSASFAFMHDGNLIVNGKGMLEVIDMNGRTVASKRLGDAQNTVGLPRMAQGVYVLKLTGDSQSKVQKIVID